MSAWSELLLSPPSLSSLLKTEASSFLGTRVGGRGMVRFSARRPRFCRSTQETHIHTLRSRGQAQTSTAFPHLNEFSQKPKSRQTDTGKHHTGIFFLIVLMLLQNSHKKWMFVACISWSKHVHKVDCNQLCNLWIVCTNLHQCLRYRTTSELSEHHLNQITHRVAVSAGNV